jgi:uncharacterized membrane protein HdeD (DUF308 family)
VLVLLTASWAAVTGILQIVVVIFLRKELEGAWLVIFSGILLLVLGVLLAIHPKASAITLIWLIGAYAVLLGGLLIVLAF